MNIDMERLRRDLIYYFGSANYIYTAAIMDVICVENADSYKLIQIAKNNGFDLNNYVIVTNNKKLSR